MALPTPTKTWQFNLNNQVVDTGTAINNHRALLLALINSLLSFPSSPASVRYSCNGTTAGTAGDGVNRWLASANLVWGNAGAAHSWIVLRLPGLAHDFLLSLEASSGTGQQFLMAVSSGGFSGGTVTNRPTAGDEVIVWSGNTFPSTAQSSYRWSMLQSADGEQIRYVLCWATAAQCVLILDKPANAVSGWTTPIVAGWSQSLLPSGLSSPSSSLRTRANSATCNIQLTCEANNTPSGMIVSDPNYGLTANELTGEWPIAPLGVVGATPGARGRHGSMVDLWYGSIGASSGDTYPLSIPQFAQFGALVLPWDGVTTPALS